MIVEYHRPETLEGALSLLARSQPKTVPLGGGSVVSKPSDEHIAVVDLQDLNLDGAEHRGNTLLLGATLTLQSLLEMPDLPIALSKAIRHEAHYNLRQVATVAGSLVAADGRSPFAAAMLALDAQLTLVPDQQQIGLGDVLPLRHEQLPGALITQISIPTNVKLAYEYVARTPSDLPVVAVAAAQWPSGRTRVTLGGFGSAPILALDGGGSSGAQEAAADAYSEAGDQWATAEYRQSVAKTLAQRCLDELNTL